MIEDVNVLYIYRYACGTGDTSFQNFLAILKPSLENYIEILTCFPVVAS